MCKDKELVSLVSNVILPKKIQQGVLSSSDAGHCEGGGEDHMDFNEEITGANLDRFMHESAMKDCQRDY